MFNFGDVVLCSVQFVDSLEVKRRPALVLWEEYNNVVVAGITSNTSMVGVSLTTGEGVIKQSVVKLNYVFTLSERAIIKKLGKISAKKKNIIINQIAERMK